MYVYSLTCSWVAVVVKIASIVSPCWQCIISTMRRLVRMNKLLISVLSSELGVKRSVSVKHNWVFLLKLFLVIVSNFKLVGLVLIFSHSESKLGSGDSRLNISLRGSFSSGAKYSKFSLKIYYRIKFKI